MHSVPPRHHAGHPAQTLAVRDVRVALHSLSTPCTHHRYGGGLGHGGVSLQPSAVTDCPPGWLPYKHTCLHQIPGALSWSEARDTCHKLSAKLPISGDNNPTETSSLHTFILAKFPSPLWLTRGQARNRNSSDTCRVLTSPTQGGATIQGDRCDKKLTGVCIKGRKGSLSLDFREGIHIITCNICFEPWGPFSL